ncbi:hypothetical protein KI387_024450, partial [Taxus chinensis]
TSRAREEILQNTTIHTVVLVVFFRFFVKDRRMVEDNSEELQVSIKVIIELNEVDNKRESQVSIGVTMKIKEVLVNALEENAVVDLLCEVEAENKVNGVMAADVAKNGPLIIHHMTTSYEKNAKNSEELGNMSHGYDQEMRVAFVGFFDFHNVLDLCAGPIMKKMIKNQESEIEEMFLEVLETLEHREMVEEEDVTHVTWRQKKR